MSPAVTVVIPTLAETKRAEGLRRAVASVLAQEGCVARPLLVVNGDRFDPALVEEWKAHPEVRLHYESIGSAPLASKIGRSLVNTDFFAFLDDDDEYLPHALVARLSALRTDSRLAVVVGNGYRYEGKARLASAWNLREAAHNPFAALLANNWLTSCGGLYRSSLVDETFFADTPAYMEWTYLAYKLCVNYEIGFVDNPGYIIHDTPDSLSKSLDYGRAYLAVLTRILELPLPTDAHRALRGKYGAALHDLSASCLNQGERWQAFIYHCRSLLQPEGLRFLLYGRRFLGF